MNLTINASALRTALHNMLSCRCPVTEAAEKAMFGYYHDHKDLAYMDMAEILEVAEVNPEPTPLHCLTDFCRYFHDDPRQFAIEQNDVLRFLGTGFHFDTVKAGLNPAVVNHPPSHLVCHLMLPGKVKSDGDGIEAVCTVCGREIQIRGMVCPPEVDLDKHTDFGVHLGTVITGLEPEQALMLKRHQNLIPGLAELAREVKQVDFASYQMYGDYASMVRERIARNFDLAGCP